ncbi:hypothetical protein [Undibacterium sp.]|uniref:hypothetical protein n=1 Tax=Undibacterium sp. TaxID=1914977 RepID=UPI0025F2ABEA|nr:hypothetical protein [Undibacterium sp.]
MLSLLSEEHLQKAIDVIGRDGISDDEIEVEIFAFAQEQMLARRLIDWLPEIFGIVLVSHMGDIHLPNTFSAKDKRGKWIELEFKVEPIVQIAVKVATEMYHAGPRNTFSNIALRSSMVNVVNRALNQSESLNGARLSGPALIGIPAEIYLPPSKPFWQRFFE